MEQSGGTSSYQQPSYASYEKLMRGSEADHVPAYALHEIYENCPDLQSKYPDARTWKDIKYCSGPFTINGIFSLDWLQAQHFYTRVNLGLRNTGGLSGRGPWSTDNLKDIQARLRSSNIESLDDAYDLQLVANDCILVRASPKPSPRDSVADQGRDNIMTLYPSFFEEGDDWLKDSLRNFLIMPSETDIRDHLGGRVQTVLHELFHSPSVLSAFDHDVKYTDEELNDKAGDGYLCPRVAEQDERDTTPDEHNLFEKENSGCTVKLTRVTAYGLQACIDLALQGNHVNIKMAEDNAESWSLLSIFRVLMFACPDLDFQAAYDEEYTPTWEEWKVYPRQSLLHHCTLLEYPRHPDTMPCRSITEHPDYDAEKDVWAAHSGRKRPESVKELLEVVDGIVKKRLKEEDEKVRAEAERRRLIDQDHCVVQHQNKICSTPRG